MKIVRRRGDENGTDGEFRYVQRGGQTLIYFQKSGTDEVDRQGPHFVMAPNINYGDAHPLAHDLNGRIGEFVCPDFADHKELEHLRAESAKWQGKVVDPKELEQLRADSAELGRLREKQREASQHRARLKELESQLD